MRTPSLRWIPSFIVLLLLVLPGPVDAASSIDEAIAQIREEIAQNPGARLEDLEERLRFLEGLAQARPIPLPEYDTAPSVPSDRLGGRLHSMDLRTGDESLVDLRPFDDSGPLRSEPFRPIPLPDFDPGEEWKDGEDEGDLGPKSCTPPSLLLATHGFPWRTTYKMLMRWNVGGTNYYYVGSAGSVRNFHLITAAHCIYSHDPNDDGSTADAAWANEVWVWPAQTDICDPFGDPDYPWGVAKPVIMHSYTAWTNDANHNWDMGYIALDRRLCERTGWMGGEASVEATSLNFNGYPVQTPYVPDDSIGQYPGYDAGNVNYYTTDRINMCAYVYGGHSGGPVWRYDGTDRYIQGVNSTSNRTGGAEATRLSSSRYQNLYDQIIPNDTTNIPPVARPELIEWVFDNSSKDLVQNSVAQGGSFSAQYNVYNVGWAATGTVTVDFYLSTNTTISTGDRLVGSRTLTLNANTYSRPTTSFTVPCSVPTGTYYFGWIARSAVAEYSTDNNTAVITDERLTVTSVVPPVPPLVSPATGASCQPTSLVLDWGAVTGAVSYDVQLGSSCGTGGIYSTTASAYSLSGLAHDSVYYWRVRSKNACGTPSGWSSCRVFFTEPAPPPAPALVSPSSSATCQPLNTCLDWNAAPSAEAYQVQIGTSCGTGSTYATGSTLLCPPNLQPQTLYYWRVRAQTACGDWGVWSACRSFSTPEAPIGIGPTLESVGLSGPTRLYAYFDKTLNASIAADERNYLVYETGNTSLRVPVINVDPAGRRVLIVLGEPLDGRRCYTLQVKNLEDECGNSLELPASLDFSSAEAYTAGCRLLACPAGDGPSLESLNCQIFLDVVEPDGTPVTGLREEDFELDGCEPAAISECLGTIPKVREIAPGRYEFYGRLHAGGHDDGMKLWVRDHCVAGSCLPIQVVSPDIVPDGLVNVQDVGVFAGDLSGSYESRSDFDFNGVIDIRDLGVFASHVGHGGCTLDNDKVVAATEVGKGRRIGLSFASDRFEFTPIDALRAGESFTFYVVAEGVDPIAGWEGRLLAPAGVKIESARVEGEGAVDVIDAVDEFVVGIGTPSSARCLLLATVRARLLVEPDEHAHLMLRPATIESAGTGRMAFVVDVEGRRELRATTPDDVGLALSSDRLPTYRGPSAILGITPNPFNPSTTIRFHLDVAEGAILRIHDVAGRLVRSFDVEAFGVGTNELVWNGTDNRGDGVASGVYYVRLEAKDVVMSKSITLLK